MQDQLKAVVDEYLPLRDVVFQTLRQAILKGELEPGERLMEIQLAERLGVSRTPVREAIRKLELEGLVVMVPRKGAEVASITEKNVQDVLEVRKALEELAVTLACQRMDESQFKQFDEQNHIFEEALKANDFMEIAKQDIDFHEMIYTAAGNERLQQMLNNLQEQMYRYHIEYRKDEKQRNKLVQEHQEIAEAIQTRNVERAKSAIRLHIDNQEMTISQNIKKESNS